MLAVRVDSSAASAAGHRTNAQRLRQLPGRTPSQVSTASTRRFSWADSRRSSFVMMLVTSVSTVLSVAQFVTPAALLDVEEALTMLAFVPVGWFLVRSTR